MSRSSRSGASKELVRKAASELIRTKGLEAVRIREVASIAGLSPASVLYHYPQNEDLLFDVHRWAISDYLDKRAEAAELFTDPKRKLAAVVSVGLPGLSSAPFGGEDNDDAIYLMLEMHAIANRGESHRSLLTELTERELALHVEIIRAGRAVGQFDFRGRVEATAKILLILEDGLALHVASDDSMTPEEAYVLYLAHAAQVLGCPSLRNVHKAMRNQPAEPKQ